MCKHPPERYYTVNFFGPIDPEDINTIWCNQIWVGCLDCGKEIGIIIPKKSGSGGTEYITDLKSVGLKNP